MRNKMKEVADRAKALAEKAKSEVVDRAVEIGDLNGDGKIDADDAKLAAAKAQEVASEAADSAVRVGKVIAQNDLAKDALTGAAIGAVVTLPLPVVGPATGAVVGAAIGVYKNLTTRRSSGGSPALPEPVDLHAEITKLDELRQKGLLTEQEFERQKRSILAKGRA